MLSVVIPTINCEHYLRETLDSLPRGLHDVIVIDNGSSDGTPAFLATRPDLRTIRFPVNIGVAPAWNYGIRLALSNGAEYVAVLNHDITLEPDTLSTLVDWVRHRGLELPTVRAVPNPERAPRVSWVSRPGDFCGFLITQHVIDRIGWFDEQYRLAYLEDLDYEMRLLDAGVSHGSCHDALVWHYGSRAITEGGVQHWDAFRDNAAYFARKWGRHYEDARRWLAAAGPVQVRSAKPEPVVSSQKT